MQEIGTAEKAVTQRLLPDREVRILQQYEAQTLGIGFFFFWQLLTRKNSVREHVLEIPVL
jgi:hypothetical protein